MNFEEHFKNLINLAKDNLSMAHLAQHSRTAELVQQQFGLDVTGPGAHSAYKPTDKIQFEHNHLTGQKQWISNLPMVNWVVLVTKCIDKEQVVLIKLDQSTKIHMVSTVGMEQTLTAHLTLDHTPCQPVCDVDDPLYFHIRRQHSLAFVAIQHGLAQALFNDLDQYTKHQKIECSYHKQKLKLQLDVMQMVWDQIPKDINLEHQAQFFYNQKNIAYAFAKKCLLDICQLLTETTGSGLYITDNQFHQRYKDALIYSSHMKNLYFSLQYP